MILSLNLNLFFIVILVWFAVTWLYNVMLGFNTRFQLQTMTSVEQSAQEFFLTVDPICHSTKSTGQILSKIMRAGPAFEDVIDMVIFDLVSMISSFLATIAALFSFSLTLGFAGSFMIITLCIFNIWAQIFKTKSFQKTCVELEDNYKAVSTETVQQAPFVRAAFASIEQVQKLTNLNKKYMISEGNSWQAGTYINVATRSIYIMSLLFIGILALNQAISGSISSTTALAIILTYSADTQDVLYVGDKIKRLANSLANINDLFDFIRGFGTQTFPVLESENSGVKKSTYMQ